MDLQGNVALHCNARFALRVVHGAHAIHLELDPLVLGQDLVLVPLTRLFRPLDQFLGRLGQHRLAS